MNTVRKIRAQLRDLPGYRCVQVIGDANSRMRMAVLNYIDETVFRNVDARCSSLIMRELEEGLIEL